MGQLSRRASEQGGRALRRVRRRYRRGRRAVRRRLRYVRYSVWGRRIRWTLVAVGGLAVLGVVWVLVTAFLARRQLDALNQRLSDVKVLVSQGRLADARLAARSLPAMADRAHRLTTGPAWWAAAEVPWLGEPLEVARGMTAASQNLGRNAVPQLLAVVDDIDPSALRVNGDTVRLAPLQKAVPDLTTAAHSLSAAERRVAGLPSDTWLGAINSGRQSLESQLGLLSGYVNAASRAARVLPDMLGADGRTRRYFVGLQNEAELRGTGGIPGAFAIATTRDGTVRFTRFESDAALLPSARGNIIETGLNFGRAYDALYGAGRPTEEFNDSNASPQFAYAARIWAAMWQKQYHQHIDGALALDPTVLSYFLAVTGPVALPDGGSVGASNVVSLTQRDNYALFSDNSERRKFLVSVLKAAADTLTSGVGSPLGLAQAASRAASERRLLVWSSDPAVEKLLQQTTYAGDIAANGRPLSALILNNSAGGKLDYYLHRTVNYSRTGCGSQRDVVVTIALTNSAPASGLPPYVTTRLDQDPPKDAKPGDSRATLDYYATGGAALQSVTIDGTGGSASVAQELGRTVVRLDLELPRGQTRTVELHLSEPAERGTPMIWTQPGVNPQTTTVFNQVCN